MTSMTGYAYAEGTTDAAMVSVEIKSVNARFLDVYVNVPSFLSPLEVRLRGAAAEKVFRGKVEINIRVKELEPHADVAADINAAVAYGQAIRQIAAALGKDGADIPLSLVVSQPGVLVFDRTYDVEKYWELIEPIFTDALDSFCEDRRREGENLRADMAEKISTLEGCAEFFKEWQPKMESMFKEQILKKFHDVIGEHIDEQRVMTEIAAMLVKYTINEEIVRLQSHLKALRAEIGTGAAPGKKIDFLCQEINREINTIGSKNQSAEVAAAVINAKDAIENIREQARNVE